MSRVQHDKKSDTQGKPMAVEVKLFSIGALFFLIVAAAYTVVADAEPVGTVAFWLLFGMWLMIAGYLWLVGRRVGPLPEDDTLGDIEQSAGEVGVFAPHSWWPLVCGVAAALAFLGTGVGWWVTGIGVAIGVIGLVGLVFEFSRGQHAH